MMTKEVFTKIVYFMTSCARVCKYRGRVTSSKSYTILSALIGPDPIPFLPRPFVNDKPYMMYVTSV